MFEVPVYSIDEISGNPGTGALNNQFILSEQNDIKNQSPNLVSLYDDSRKTTKRNVKYEDEEEEKNKTSYIGLYSNVIYDSEGNIKPSSKSILRNKRHREERSRTGSFNPLRTYDLYVYGLEPLPRPVSAMRVIRDSPATVQLYTQDSNLSEKAVQIVTKNNYLTGESISPHRSQSPENLTKSSRNQVAGNLDPWIYRGLRLRHTHIVSSLVHIGILRNDYNLASKAFALLIRSPLVDIRTIWTIGLEILVWRREQREAGLTNNECLIPFNKRDVHTLPETSQTNGDDQFLQWMIVNYPNLRREPPTKGKKRPRAPDFYPHLIMTRLRHANPKVALDRLQEIMLESPYSDDPIYYALCGIATLQLMTIEQKQERMSLTKLKQLGQKANAYFDDCIKRGGVLPTDFLDFEIEALSKEQQTQDESKEQDGDTHDIDRDHEVGDDVSDKTDDSEEYSRNMSMNRGLDDVEFSIDESD